MLLPLQGVLASPTHKPRVPLRSALGYALLGFQPVFDKESSLFSSVTLCLTKSFLCDSVPLCSTKSFPQCSTKSQASGFHPWAFSSNSLSSLVTSTLPKLSLVMCPMRCTPSMSFTLSWSPIGTVNNSS